MTGAVTAPRRAAFFDLDRTLIPGSSLFLLARGAYERDLFRVRDILHFAWGQFMFRLRGEQEKNMEKTRASTLEFVAGRSRDELQLWGREIVEERILPIVYADIVRVIDGHRERGDLTFLLTAAPIELAEVIAEALEMTGALGTVSEVDGDGYYTGRLIGPPMHGSEKAKAAADLAAQHGIALMDCSAYSDSKNDLPLLESVSAPHAVNPEYELRRVAVARGWPIHELRTRRRALLIGIPAGLGGATVFWSGVAAGAALQRKKQANQPRGPLERFAQRFHL